MKPHPMTAIKELSAAPAGAAFPVEWYDITPEGHFWLEWRFRAFLAQLDALGLPRSAPWHGLDLGCGHGMVRRQLEAHTAWVTDGADLNRTALARNRTRGGETLLYDVHDRNPTLAGRYDFVLLFDVLEHVADPAGFLDAVLHHLRPGGWLFVNVPALDRLSSAFDRAIGHLRRYDRRMIRAELAPHGLEVRDVRYWGFSMLPYLVLRKLFPPRGASLARVIEHGVTPPRPWMNRLILRLCALETTWLHHPVLGTSLLAAATKPTGR